MFKGGKLKFKGTNNKRYCTLYLNLYYNFVFFSSTVSKNSSNSSPAVEKLKIPDEITSIPNEGWIKATEPEDFLGPIVFIVPGEEGGGLLKVDEDTGTLKVEPIDSTTSIEHEPSSAANVLIGQNLIPHIFSFKSAFGKYLTSDSLGQVACNKEAVGPVAEWTLIIKPEGVSLHNVYDKFPLSAALFKSV